MVDWRFMFLRKNVHKQVSIFNNTLMNIFTNGTLFSVRYSEKDIQDIQDIRKSTQYQEIGDLFTPPNTF